MLIALAIPLERSYSASWTLCAMTLGAGCWGVKSRKAPLLAAELVHKLRSAVCGVQKYPALNTASTGYLFRGSADSEANGRRSNLGFVRSLSKFLVGRDRGGRREEGGGGCVGVLCYSLLFVVCHIIFLEQTTSRTEPTAKTPRELNPQVLIINGFLSLLSLC